MAAPADRELPDLRTLRALLIVSEAGSLARGAVLANVPQSTISRQLAAIERQVGGRIFHRTGRGVELTELGDRFLSQARSVVSEAAHLVSDIAEFTGRVSSKVAIGTLTAFIDPFIAKLYAEVTSRFPHTRLRVLEGSSSQMEDWITAGAVDLCITHGQGRKTGSQAVEIGRVTLHLVSRPGDPNTAGPTIKFQRLAGLPLIVPGPESGLRSMLDKFAHNRRVALNIAMEADSLTVQKVVAREPGTYTIVADVAVAGEVASGQLSASRIVDPVIRRPIVLAATSQHPMSSAARQIYRLVRELAVSGPLTAPDVAG